VKVLIIGSSSKEHAMIWKLLSSEKFKDLEIIVCPGNLAFSRMAECINDVDINDVDRLLEIAIARNINLTIVGEAKLFQKAIVDKFKIAGKAILGPDSLAAVIESSNVFAKNLMLENNIPSAKFVVFDHLDIALAYINSCKFPIKLRSDKVFESDIPFAFAEDFKAARRLLMEMFKTKFLSKETPRIIIEEVTEGYEFTINTICDGNISLSLPPVQAYRDSEMDHYSDRGAYAPTPILTDALMYQIRTFIIDPTLKAMQNLARPYSGLLAFDIVLDLNEGMKPKLLQYRSCLADSDAQVILPLLDEDLYELLSASARSDLSFYKDGLHKFLGSALAVNIVASDRTEESSHFHSINVMDSINLEIEKINGSLKGIPLVFYGTRNIERASKKLGQAEVFGATAVAESLLDAQILAYKLADSISLPSKAYERDIGDHGMID
jgi:phosphoribosylamine---glycine ligase